jgi:trehalose 6-phosphate synthase/phosphatase
MVEASALENNKGAVVQRVIEQDGPFDAVCCAGDDLTDETMFELQIPNLFSIKVGPGRTQARVRVSDPEAFRRLLGCVFLGKEQGNRPA